VRHRFYRNPDDVDAENAAAKLDRAAAHRRSAIRREPSSRPAREQSSSTGLANPTRNRHELSSRQARMRANYERQEADAHSAIEAELERLRRQGSETSNRLQAERARRQLIRHLENDLSIALTSAPNDVLLTPIENEPATHGVSTVDQILLPRPTRESNLRFEVAANSSPHSTSSQQPPLFMPSPPHSLSGAFRSRPVDGPLDSWETTPPLTQDFAPARATRAARSGSRSPTDPLAEVNRTVVENDGHGLETPPPESWENSYPPLRRVPHMSPRPLPRTTIDGLGDRRRSPSPPSEDPEEENWTNLRASLNNGDSAPSTSTSFASMADLVSTPRSSSHRSANTQNTSTSFGEIGASTDDTCDLPPGITEEDVRQIRERHRRTAGRVGASRTRPSGSDYSGTSRPRDSPMSILLHEARAARTSGQWRRERDELFVLQAIAERQQSHEQVPDDWWALAGLHS